jgi:hypothetical protein
MGDCHGVRGRYRVLSRFFIFGRGSSYLSSASVWGRIDLQSLCPCQSFMDVLKVHPSGRIVASYDRSKRAKARSLLPLSQFVDRSGAAPPRDQQVREIEATGGVAAFGVRGPAPLGLSSIANSVTPIAARGSKGITSFGRQRVRDAATVLEDESPRGTMALWTVTIPPGVESSICSRWARFTDLLRNQLRKDLVKAGLSGDIVFCSEYQENREKNYGFPVLHLHFLFRGALIPSKWPYSVHHYQNRVRQAIRAVCGAAGDEIDYSACSRVEKVRKSCASYLGKYMSKGCGGPPRAVDECRGSAHPSSWYGLGRALLQKVRRAIHLLRGPEATRLISHLVANAVSLMKFNRWATFQGREGQTLHIAWYGDLLDRRALDGVFGC